MTYGNGAQWWENVAVKGGKTVDVDFEVTESEVLAIAPRGKVFLANDSSMIVIDRSCAESLASAISAARMCVADGLRADK